MVGGEQRSPELRCRGRGAAVPARGGEGRGAGGEGGAQVHSAAEGVREAAVGKAWHRLRRSPGMRIRCRTSKHFAIFPFVSEVPSPSSIAGTVYRHAVLCSQRVTLQTLRAGSGRRSRSSRRPYPRRKARAAARSPGSTCRPQRSSCRGKCVGFVSPFHRLKQCRTAVKISVENY